jgi:type II secretory pathway pseudopilin PulG
VKNAILIILLLAVAGLFAHSRKIADDLDTVRTQNDQLSQQIDQYKSENEQLQAKDRQLSAELGEAAGLSHSVPSQSGANSLQGSNPLDRPAYSH